MKQLILLLSLCLPVFALAQTKTVEMGEIDRSTVRYADIKIRNYGEQTVHLVRIEHSPELVYRVSQRYTKPDSSFTIRVQVNPDTTGSFDHVLRIYLSDNQLPFEIRIVGEVTEMPDYTDVLQQRCPEFVQETTHSRDTETEFTLTAVDAATGAVLTRSTVTLIRDGMAAESWITGGTGSLRKQLPQGFFYFVVSHSGYETTETGIYVTPDIDTVYIPLKKYIYERPKEEQPDPEPLLADEPERIPDKDVEKVLLEQIRTDTAQAEYAFSDTSVYRPVNIVFVLDMSSSMKMGEKMDLLKFSLQQLVDELRPSDQITFVTYSENARVYLSPTYCIDKQPIRQKITDLKAEGRASSTRGIKLGYKELKRRAEPGSANLVIVITDGAFNRYSNDYQKVVQQHAGHVVFSVVGIQCSSVDEKHLKAAAEFGNGRYIPINKLADAQQRLLEEIRKVTFRQS